MSSDRPTTSAAAAAADQARQQNQAGPSNNGTNSGQGRQQVVLPRQIANILSNAFQPAVRLLYQPLSPASNCADVLDANIDIRLVEAIDDGLIKVSFNCSPGCDYETTFILELSAGNWLIQSARHRM